MKEGYLIERLGATNSYWNSVQKQFDSDPTKATLYPTPVEALERIGKNFDTGGYMYSIKKTITF